MTQLQKIAISGHEQRSSTKACYNQYQILSEENFSSTASTRVEELVQKIRLARPFFRMAKLSIKE